MRSMQIAVIIAVLTYTSFFTPAQSQAEEVFEVSSTPIADDLFLNSNLSQNSSLIERTESFLRERSVDPRITLEVQAKQAVYLANDNSIDSIEYQFSLDGISLCQYQFKSHQTSDGLLVSFGIIPNHAIDREYNLSNWPSQDAAQAMVDETMIKNSLSSEFIEASVQPCLWSDEGNLRPVYVFNIESNGLGYVVVVDDQRSYKFQPTYFHTAGKASVYPNNILDGETKEYPLREMKASGYLENSYFATVVESPFEGAIASNLDFAFDPEAQLSQFQETSLFTNANRALEWLESMGYKNFGAAPIRIIVHAKFMGDINNAMYQPSSDGASIFVGDGDGQVLQNLATDADVVGHELGHHVVYHTVTEIQGESLVLHEGLADYFNFARTGNACLGESICPDTSFGNRICYVPGKCLRTAENSLTMTSTDLPTAPHQRGQVISGMLWDLNTKDGLLLEDVTHLVLSSIDLLVKNSGYKHFIVGLMMADQALFEGKNCNTIFARAIARGFSNSLGGVTCEVIGLAAGGKVTDVVNDPDPQLPSAAKSKSSSKPTCGSLGGNMSGRTDDWIFVIYMVPIFALLMRRFWLGYPR